MPSERAVGWLGLSEAVLVDARPSGSSSTLPLGPQAPGMTLAAGGAVARERRADELSAPPGSADGDVPLIVTSGITFATFGLPASAARSALDTVADMALRSWKLLMWVACTDRSWRTSGACAVLIAATRAAADRLPTRAALIWPLRITITCCPARLDSCALSFGESVTDVRPRGLAEAETAIDPSTAATDTAAARIDAIPRGVRSFELTPSERARMIPLSAEAADIRSAQPVSCPARSQPAGTLSSGAARYYCGQAISSAALGRVSSFDQGCRATTTGHGA
jgi:hypothetical protein